MIRKVLFLIGNRHFLIRKRHFGVFKWGYVWPVQFAPSVPLFVRSSSMIRNRLLAAVAIIAAVVLTACSDMTAPKNDCPVISGSSTCLVH
jgi:hypothetical protein